MEYFQSMLEYLHNFCNYSLEIGIAWLKRFFKLFKILRFTLPIKEEVGLEAKKKKNEGTSFLRCVKIRLGFSVKENERRNVWDSYNKQTQMSFLKWRNYSWAPHCLQSRLLDIQLLNVYRTKHLSFLPFLSTVYCPLLSFITLLPSFSLFFLFFFYILFFFSFWFPSFLFLFLIFLPFSTLLPLSFNILLPFSLLKIYSCEGQLSAKRFLISILTKFVDS